MIAEKSVPLKKLFRWTIHHVFWLLLLMTIVSLGYHYDFIDINLHLPWYPVAVIGTAVAFYVGFKNNQAYDRKWEARKIWGGIVNESRTWGMLIDGYVTNQFRDFALSEHDINVIKKRIIYRHIAWLYTHRTQLLAPTSWEHISQSGMVSKLAKYYQKNFGIGLVTEEDERSDIRNFLSNEEYNRLTKHKNTATQIINEQSRDLKELRKNDLIDDFRHTQMSDVLRSLYTLQGKNERIKNFPFPRQYASMSRIFTGIFISLIPFSMIPSILELGPWGIWLAAPVSALIGWVYVMMEVVGDYSENPFQGMANDIPMMSLCRTIEIDLREMLKETELPPAIKAKDGILM